MRLIIYILTFPVFILAFLSGGVCAGCCAMLLWVDELCGGENG